MTNQELFWLSLTDESALMAIRGMFVLLHISYTQRMAAGQGGPNLLISRLTNLIRCNIFCSNQLQKRAIAGLNYQYLFQRKLPELKLSCVKQDSSNIWGRLFWGEFLLVNFWGEFFGSIFEPPYSLSWLRWPGSVPACCQTAWQWFSKVTIITHNPVLLFRCASIS